MTNHRKKDLWKRNNPFKKTAKINILLIFYIIILGIPSVITAQECGIHLSITTRPSSCQANGEIYCQLYDTAGLHLEQIRYTYIPESGIDSITQTEQCTINQLRPGQYTVIVSALCPTHLSQADAFIIVSDTITHAEIEQQYNVPHCGIPYNIYSQTSPYGIVPAHTCESNGQVQIQIKDGTFPYTVDVFQIEGTDTHFVKSVVFDTNQHFGTQSLRHDYQHYYTIDSLGIGNYIFLCHDGCGYYMPRLSATVPRLKSSLSHRNFMLRNSSGIPTSYNIVTFKHAPANSAFINYNDDYYQQRPSEEYWFEYRFINPTLSEQSDTTSWRPFPENNLTEFMIRDTLQDFEDYAGIWFQNIILQTRVMPCPDTTLTYQFTIYPQGQNYISYSVTYINDESEPSYYDSCGRHSGHTHRENILRHLYTYHSSYNCINASDSLNCHRDHGYTLPQSISSISEGMTLHNYITLPVHCRTINLSADTVITSTTLTDMQYIWSWLWPAIPELDGDTILIEVLDDKDCPLLSQIHIYKYYRGIVDYADTYTRFQWRGWLDNEHRYCPDAQHSIGLFQYYGTNYNVLIDGNPTLTYQNNIIRLIESPSDNAYNFEALATQQGAWDYTKVHPEQTFDISFINYPFTQDWKMPGIKLTADGLPNGRYVWEVVYPCDRPNDTIVQQVEYTKVPEWKQPLSYQFEPQCDRLAITPTSGQLGYGDSLFTTYFNIRTISDSVRPINAVMVGDTLYAGIIGDYLLGAYALPEGNFALLNDNPCYLFDSVTTWNGNLFMFDYLYSYVCNAEDSIGFVRARGKRGNTPYTYRLFSQSNGAGHLIEQNSTGDFMGIPCHFNQNMSIEMEDNCGSHFITNFTVSNMERIRKGWAESNQHNITMHPGDTCHLYSIALGEVTYHWYGPNGFEAHTCAATVPITNELQSGKYYIYIVGTGCGIVCDSILLLVEEEPCPEAIDYEDNHYPSVRINNLCWTQCNLRSRFYSDGRPIPHPDGYHSELFPNTEQNIETFGRLYNWQDAIDLGHPITEDSIGHLRGICPTGWYLPDSAQYAQLTTHGTEALRASQYWINGTGGNNQTGFSALPAGIFNGSRSRYEHLLGYTRFWASSLTNSSENSSIFQLTHFCNEAICTIGKPGDQYSVRCIWAEK